MADYIIKIDATMGPQGPIGPIGDVTPAAIAAKEAAEAAAAQLENINAASIKNLPEGDIVSESVQDAVNELDYKKLPIATNNYVSKYGSLMVNNTLVTIDCYGDSTTFGYDSVADSQVSEPPPTALMRVLKAYYGAVNIIVNNYGVPGQTTTQKLTTFAADIATSVANVVFIEYGLNDITTLTLDQFKQNMIKLTKIALNGGKDVVLSTPNPLLLLYTNVANTGNGRMNIMPLFAEAIRQIAKQFGVGLIDHFEAFTRHMSSQISDGYNLFPDGVHLAQQGYSFKGTQMAQAFIPTPKIYGEIKIPAISPCFVLQNVTAAQVAKNSSVNNLSVAVKATSFFDIVTPGLDLYVALNMSSATSSNITIKLDGTSISTFSSVESTVPAGSFLVDQEILIAKDVSPGCHLLEIIANSGAIMVGYIKFKKTRVNYPHYTIPGGTPIIKNKVLLAKQLVFTSSNTSDQKALVREIPLSRTFNFELSFSAQLSALDGVILFGLPVSISGSSDTGIVDGLTLYLDASGHPTLREGTYTTPRNVVAMNTVDYRAATHAYKLTYANGVINLYIDGAPIGSAYTLQSNYCGGYLGLERSGIAGDLTVNDIMFCYT